MPGQESITVETREIRAVRPRPGEAGLRAAYLDLLKLSLCDLAGANVLSVGRTGSGRTFTRELAGEQLKLRAGGLDWPLNGLTMIGLARLDDLQACVEAVVADGVEGDLIEAGAWRGGASILMRATLDSLGADDRTVYVADSFQGFPEPDPEAFPADSERDLHTIDFLAVPLDEVRDYFERLGLDHGVRFVPGFFQDTLPALRGRRWSLVRLDGDTYESTMLALRALYPGLAAGGFVHVDDYKLFEECRRAVDDFRSEHGIIEPLEEVDWNGVRWRRRSPPEQLPGEADDVPAEGPADERAIERESGERVPPTLRELRLERQLGEQRDAGRQPGALAALARRLGRSR